MRTIVLAILLSLFSGVLLAKVEQLDRVVAIVDDDIILQSELTERIRNVRERLLAQNTPLPSDAVLKERILEQLVLESIQLQMADRVGIRVSDSELNQTMQNIAKQNKLTLEEFQQQLAEDGITYQTAREQIKREMIVSRYQQRMVDSRVRVTEKEVSDFLQSAVAKASNKAEYRIAHILLTFEEGNDDAAAQAMAQARDLVEQVRSGSSFAQLAVAHSKSSTALQGGDLGWRGTDELPTLFVDVVPALKKGQVADPLKTSSAVHLVYLADVKGGASRIVEQAKVRHILIQLNELRNDLQSKDLISDIYQRVRKGEDFAELAKAYTDDTITAGSGGSLNWVSPGQMVPAFEKVMTETPVGEVSEPFRTEFGWHILQVMERRTEDIGDLVQANQARQILHRQKYEEELQNWLGEIRDEAYVELKL